jgi:predicted nucleotide-binding protein
LKTAYPRPRQNVVLEFGFFVGKLGRQRITCLLKKPLESPSDMQGIVTIRFKESVEEIRTDILKELKGAGYRIKTETEKN